MAIYDLTHTAAQIDEAATKVLTTGEIAKIVRDEVKAQLSAITTGIASVPVFDSTQIMKLISIANFAKVVGGQVGVDYISQTLAAGASITIGSGAQGYGFYSVVSLTTGYSCFVQLRYRAVTLINEASGATKNITIALEGNTNFTITNNGSSSEVIAVRKV